MVQPPNQSNDQYINQTTKQTTNQSNLHSLPRSINQPVKHQIELSAN